MIVVHVLGCCVWLLIGLRLWRLCASFGFVLGLVDYCLVVFVFDCTWGRCFWCLWFCVGDWCVVIAVGVGFLIGCGWLVLCFALDWWI